MGAHHFAQMHADALELDQQAMPIAMTLHGAENAAAQSALGGGFWDKLPSDAVMEKARRLIDMRDSFSEGLKVMLLDRRITVLAYVPGQIAPRKITDPNVIDFDDPKLSLAAFTRMLETF